jgi:hypothetical protein
MVIDRVQPVPYGAGSLSMLILARVGLAVAGGLCLAAAALFDLAFVRTHLAADGSVTASQAAALPAARLLLAAFGACLLLLAAFPRRLLGAPWLASLSASRPRLEWSIFLAPPMILLGLAGYKLVRGPGDPLYLLAVREDSLVEWLTALAYLAVFVVALPMIKKLYLMRRYLLVAFHAVLGACGLFVAMEEISYAQRLLGFATPDRVGARNVQGEVTIHNLDFMEGLFFTVAPLAVGVFGMLGFVRPALRRSIGGRRLSC